MIFCSISSMNQPKHLDDIVAEIQSGCSRYEQPSIFYVYSFRHEKQAVCIAPADAMANDLERAFDRYLEASDVQGGRFNQEP